MTPSTKASTDAGDEQAGGAARHLWGAADLVFLAISILALAAGLFPERLLQADLAGDLPHPPTLQAVVAAQAGFLMLFCPLLLARRRLARPGAGGVLGQFAVAAAEYLILIVVSVPVYWVAAWFADATVVDVLRGVLYLTAVALAGWGVSLWAVKGSPASVTVVALASAVIALGLPVTYYLLAEVTELSVSAGWLFSASPATCAYSVAASRAGHWYPMPVWSWALWVGVAGASLLARVLLDRKGL